MHFRDESGKRIEFEPYSLKKNALFDKGCITCGQMNLEVEYHGDRHVCLTCRTLLKTYDGDSAGVFLNEYGEIEAWAHKAKSLYDKVPKSKFNLSIGISGTTLMDLPQDASIGDVEERDLVYFQCDHTRLKIYEFRCYATFSGP